jgi:diguanylate cyclase (GGDEF)-like protein
MHRLLHNLATIREWWIGVCTGRDPLRPLDEESYRQRILAITSFFWLLTVVSFTVVSYFVVDMSPEGRSAATALFVTTGFAVLATVLILRYLQNRLAAMHILLLAFTSAFTVACVFFGGTGSPTYALLILAPVMAAIVGSIWAALFWTSLVMLIWVVILGLERIGVEFTQIIMPYNYNLAITLAYASMGLAVVSVIMVYAELNKQLRHSLQKANRELEYLSSHDELTSLYNRRFYEQRMALALERAEAQDKPLGLLVFDLDEFKEINDTYGHGMGDALLMKLGERLRTQVRETDLVARLGGDEFAVIMENMRSAEDMPLIAAKLMTAIKQPVKLRNIEIRLGVSCGVAVFPADGDTQQQLEEKADRAMYRAKELGSAAPAMLH